MSILITGGSDYIGSHTLVALIEAGYDFVVYDNFSNSSKESINRVEKIINKSISFEEDNIRDKELLKKVFAKYKIDSVIHFAGLKAVGESVEKPLEYYDNNVVGTLRLLEVMKEFNCRKIVFSSSATVYGNLKSNPIKEDFPVGVTINPYGTSKYICEKILEDLYISNNSFKIVILRYFNPVDAHESGTIGEEPNGIPNNLMPYISQAAVGIREYLSIFRVDYDTLDGIGIKDYIHVVDLALGHVKAIDYLNSNIEMKPLIVNLETGKGYSIIDMVKAFEKASGKKNLCKIVDRRAGDIATCYSDASLAKKNLGWDAKKDIENMCIDSWKWQCRNFSK
jgi:UDP-glucose 4-epimerase